MTIAGAVSGYNASDIMSGAWSVVVSAQMELLLFAAAMCAYFHLFMQKLPRKQSKLAKKMKAMSEESFPEGNLKVTHAKQRGAEPKPHASAQKEETVISDVGKHITLIRNCAMEKNLEGAFAAFETLKQSGVELNSVIYNTVLDACVECRSLKAAESW